MFGSWSFEYYASVPFWAAVVGVTLLVRLAGARARARGALLALASSALLLAIPRFRPVHLALVWLVTAVAWGAARALASDRPSPRLRRAIAVGGICGVLAFLAFFKYRFVQDVLRDGPGLAGPPSAYLSLIGVSYFSFKAIHGVIEAYRRTLPAPDPLTFANYITFFPAFISGPISRYADFAKQLGAAATSPLRKDLAAGGERIVHGLFKKFVLVPIILPYILTQRVPSLAQATAADAVLGLYAYALYFYFDFSGYTDLAIGAARLMGIGLPENFDQPFLKKNIRDLWSSWHMSLTTWLVDYVYWPLVRKLRNVEYFRTRPLVLSMVGMNATFIACGVWHGEALNFVAWGAYHGLGISAVNLYQRQKRRIPSPLLQRYFQSRASRVVGALATFNFFAAGLALFVLDLGSVGTLLGAVFGR